MWKSRRQHMYSCRFCGPPNNRDHRYVFWYTNECCCPSRLPRHHHDDSRLGCHRNGDTWSEVVRTYVPAELSGIRSRVRVKFRNETTAKPNRYPDGVDKGRFIYEHYKFYKFCKFRPFFGREYPGGFVYQRNNRPRRWCSAWNSLACGIDSRGLAVSQKKGTRGGSRGRPGVRCLFQTHGTAVATAMGFCRAAGAQCLFQTHGTAATTAMGFCRAARVCKNMDGPPAG